MSRDLARLLRWRNAGFRSRRLPYVVEQVMAPFRLTWWALLNPTWALFAFRIRMHYSAGWKYPPVPM